MISCALSHNTSLWAEGRDVWLAGAGDHDRTPFTDIYRVPGEAPVIGAVQVTDGVVHLLTADRVVWVLGLVVSPMGGVIQKIGHLP